MFFSDFSIVVVFCGTTMIPKVYCVLFVQQIITGVTWGQSGQYTVPELKFYAFSPKGVRVELPDQPGVELFVFHGKLNDKLEPSREGDINGDITSATGGKWVFEDPDFELRVGDKIYYWVYVQYNGAGYVRNDLMWEVTEISGNTVCETGSTSATGADKNICVGNIIFEDNFDGSAVDTNKWIIQKYIPSVSDDDHYEFVSYQNKVENIFIRNSILYLKPIAASSRTEVEGYLDLSNGCTRTNAVSCTYQQIGGYILPPVVSAKILSKMSFKYGKVEIKAKLPKGDWIYPQIELIPKNKLPSYPKIHIAYSRGNAKLTLADGSDLGSSLLFGGPASAREEPRRSEKLRSKRLSVALGNDMRTYIVTWSPARIELTIDSELYGTVLSNEYTGFDSEYQIALGVGVGGNYDFPDGIKSGNFQKPWVNFAPRTMKDFFDQRNFWISTWLGDDVALQIDSVKVWAI